MAKFYVSVDNKLEEVGKGNSAYDLAVFNGFVGTEQEWLDSLKGENISEEELLELIESESTEVVSEDIEEHIYNHILMKDMSNSKIYKLLINNGNIEVSEVAN